MNRQANNRLASKLIEQYPYAIQANDDGYNIHRITANEGSPTKLLLTFEDECLLRMVYISNGEKYFYHNGNRIFLSSFYNVWL